MTLTTASEMGLDGAYGLCHLVLATGWGLVRERDLEKGMGLATRMGLEKGTGLEKGSEMGTVMEMGSARARAWATAM